MTFRKTIAAAAAAASLVALAPAAQATLALRLSDGTSTVTIVDGGIGDLNAADGAITFVGGIGGFSINVSTALGDALTSYMGIHMDSINNSFGVGTLQIAMTETGLSFGTAGPTGILTQFGGVAGGTVSGRTYVDDANTAFGMGDVVFDSGTLGAGAFARTGWDTTSLTDPFSMTMVVNITHLQGATTSFNIESRVPTPGTLALLGAALLGFGATARKRAKS